jgi:bacteriorhodopsin
MNIGGWGPREGVAAWAFSSAGLGAAHGVTVATTFGVLALVATLPGGIVLIAGLIPRRSERLAVNRMAVEKEDQFLNNAL